MFFLPSPSKSTAYLEPHGAAPGAAHVGELDLAVLQHLERVQELLAEHLLAAAVIALRGEHGDGVLRQPVAAERGLAAPDREQHVARHAELVLDRRERTGVLGGELLGLRRQVRDAGLADVGGRRLHELRLPARRRAFAPGQLEIGQRQIRLKPARRRLERAARNPERLRLRPELLQPFLKAGIGRHRRGNARCRKPADHDDARIVSKSTHDLLALSRCRENLARGVEALRRQRFDPAGR
jgi:hypothetical protein